MFFVGRYLLKIKKFKHIIYLSMRNKQPISFNVVRDLPDVKGKHFAGSFAILSDFQCQKNFVS